MPITKGRIKFIAIPTDIAHPRLSLEAIGLFCFIMAEKEQEISIELLSKKSCEPLKKVKAAIKELERYGYIHLISKGDYFLSQELDKAQIKQKVNEAN